MLKFWENLPTSLRKNEIKPYYDYLSRKKVSLLIKRVFDFFFSLILLVLMGPLMFLLALMIKLDSPGPIFYFQKRVTKDDKDFMIYKFRTMVPDADQLGHQVTVSGDPRVTKIGSFLRKYRLDELPQLINIFKGEMTFVGTRPEVRKYVNAYTDEMRATLLIPAGVTSLASIKYKNEQSLLDQSSDVDRTYIESILPDKMAYNLDYLKKFSFMADMKIICMTLIEVFGQVDE